ncbi:tRNA (m1A) methyltransferase non-catalytic subunit Gcd10 [Schizosaccharomyces osmophilus]|uniref:tRNA (adenine(58)-N(1))-methyltransferase non-catalytic subunit TRM6 n=1 Tax=Schizosaccharomyces osmophilus TaxID=2545709 RepID=A0AAE9WCN3_9SCHI|nr:tRNA (m1A) methyltransferase non-catalytic subunit Gcd10 [Schizosaccharomyces osmophilus]WBW73041.1 tRNA (m1A) methyltransferase non-catalytic subunit Gcd10 [Schizosaccharomyces osmophilus]
MLESSPIIQENSPVFIKLPSENIRFVTLKPNNTISLGKFGSFCTDDLFGKTYDETFEIYEPKKIRVLKTREVQSLEEENKTNKELMDCRSNQLMSQDEIEELRKQIKEGGLRGEEAIRQLTSKSLTFDQKTQYAQAKYVNRKGEKYLQQFRALRPCLETVTEYMLDHDQYKIMELTADCSTYMMTLGNAQPGGRYLVVDETGCLFLGSLLERLGGDCKVTLVHPNEQPNSSCLELWGKEYTEESLVEKGILRTLNWLQVIGPEEALKDMHVDDCTEEELNEMKLRHKKRYESRKASYARLQSSLEDFEKGNFDALFVLSNHTPMSVLNLLLPKIGSSRPVLVYSPYQQVLVDTHHELFKWSNPCEVTETNNEDITNDESSEKHELQDTQNAWVEKLIMLDIHEIRTRPYQVLPERTHPFMSIRGDMGYVLSGLKVLSSVCTVAAGRFPKRQKQGAGNKKKANTRV